MAVSLDLEQAGYDWAYARLNGSVFLPSNAEDLRIHTTPASERVALLWKLAASKDDATKRGIGKCLLAYNQQQASQSRILVASLPDVPLSCKCELCGLSMTDREEHMDMHFRTRCLEERLLAPCLSFAEIRAKATRVSKVLSKRAVERLEKEMAQPDLKPATLARMRKQLQAQDPSGPPLGETGCGIARGWFQPTDIWLKPLRSVRLSDPKHDSLEQMVAKVVPMDVLRYGRKPCVKHKTRGFWQETFPHIVIPYHWQPYLFLDQTAQKERACKKRTLVTTDQPNVRRRCSICNEPFHLKDAPMSAKQNYVIVDACVYKHHGTVHNKCANALREQAQQKENTITTHNALDARRCAVCGEGFLLKEIPHSKPASFVLSSALVSETAGLVHAACAEL